MQLLDFLRTVLHPDRYHGHLWKPPFFEGWYFKLVDASEQHRYSIIPGVFLGGGQEPAHAFVQVLNGVTGQVIYQSYPADQFDASRSEFRIRVGDSRFSLDGLSLDLDSPAGRIAGDVSFRGLTPWPVTYWSPGIMGPFGWLPRLQCNHGVVSLDHELSGALSIDGEEVSFDDGRGYIEKDWGRSFPSAWVWLQSNHFEEPGTSLTASIANVPLGILSIRGFIVGVLYGERIYRFATYTSAWVEDFSVDDASLTLILRDRKRLLEIIANRAEAGVLRGPSGKDMGVRVPETLRASVSVRLLDMSSSGKDLVFEGVGRNAGLEIVGDVRGLLGA